MDLGCSPLEPYLYPLVTGDVKLWSFVPEWFSPTHAYICVCVCKEKSKKFLGMDYLIFPSSLLGLNSVFKCFEKKENNSYF